MTIPLGERIANIDKNIASVRLDKNKFFNLIKDAGFIQGDGSADVRAFNKAAAKVGIDVKDRSANNMQKITDFLTKKSGGSYKNVGMFSAKSLAENAASQSEGFLGEYAEQYSAATKEEFWDDAKKFQRKVNKEKISSADKVKKIARGLKLKWAVPIGVTSTLLTKMGFGAVGHLMTTEMGDAELPKEPMADQAVKNIDFSGPSANTQLLEQLSQDAVMNKRGGGMTDINYMTRPLGYALGGPAGMTEIEQIIRDAKASKAPAEVRHPIKKIMSDRIPVDPYHVLTDKEFKRKDPIEMLKAVSGKGLDALKRLAEETIGAGPAEGSESYLGKEEIIKMETDDLLGELKSMGASHENPLFPDIANRPGNKWKTYNTMKLILDELMSRLDLD